MISPSVRGRISFFSEFITCPFTCSSQGHIALAPSKTTAWRLVDGAEKSQSARIRPRHGCSFLAPGSDVGTASNKTEVAKVCDIQGRRETRGRTGQAIHLAPLQTDIFETFRPRTGLVTIFEGACPKCGQFSEKFFHLWNIRIYQHHISDYSCDDVEPLVMLASRSAARLARSLTGPARCSASNA